MRVCIIGISFQCLTLTPDCSNLMLRSNYDYDTHRGQIQ